MSYFLCLILSIACSLFVQKLQNEQEKGNKFNAAAKVQQKNDIRKKNAPGRVFFIAFGSLYRCAMCIRLIGALLRL